MRADDDYFDDIKDFTMRRNRNGQRSIVMADFVTNFMASTNVY